MRETWGTHYSMFIHYALPTSLATSPENQRNEEARARKHQKSRHNLSPRPYLRVAEAEALRQLVPVGGREVLLVQEPLLQLEDLVVGERRPALPLLLRRLFVAEEVEVAAGPVCGGGGRAWLRG